MLSRRSFVGCGLVTFGLLPGCSDAESSVFYLRQALALRTPEGPRVASSVIRMTVKYYPTGLPMTNTYLTASLEGQAPFLRLEGTRTLALVLPQSENLIRIFAGHAGVKHLDSRASRQLYDQLPQLVDNAVIQVPRNRWPRGVLFEDRADPVTARSVARERPDWGLGEGYQLDGFTISLVGKTPLTTGLLEEMPWLRTATKAPIGGQWDATDDLKTDTPRPSERFFRTQFIRQRSKN